MFTNKKTQLFDTNKKSAVKTNAFVSAGMKKGAETLSGNMALKYSTTGNDFVDQFGKLGSYKAPRSFESVSNDMSALWATSPFLCVCFVLYIRLITRVVSIFSLDRKTSTVQRGAGLKHEGMLRMIWLHIFHEETFWKNIHLFISVGSWHDVIKMLAYDLQYNGWKGRVLNWNTMGSLILAGLENPNTTNLVKKYLPQIKANSKCTTIESQADNIIAKWICSLLFEGEKISNYKKYRLLKTSGTAHQWQQLISQGKHELVNFDTVAGRALALMVSSKYITNNGLEDKYDKWISSKPIAKFTGYVHELFQKLPTKKYQIDTLNAQFKGLVETAKKNAKSGTSMIVVRDTSGSMGSPASGTKMTCGNIAKSLALFFSEMLPDGYFADSWIEFNHSAKMHKWKGSTPYEKWTNDHSGYVGDTNFLSVIRLFNKIRSDGVSEDEFPTGILCISDGEFNPAQLGRTNVESARNILSIGGFSDEYVKNFKIVLWNLQSDYYGPGTGEKFETYGGIENVYYFSGYDGAVIAFLTGVEGQKSEPKTAEELFHAAMNQEILQMVEI